MSERQQEAVLLQTRITNEEKQCYQRMLFLANATEATLRASGHASAGAALVWTINESRRRVELWVQAFERKYPK